MRIPVVTLVVSSASVRSFNARMPTVPETVARVINCVQAGAMNIHQPVSALHADQVLSELVLAARRVEVRVYVSLPTGEIVDTAEAVLRPAASVASIRVG